MLNIKLEEEDIVNKEEMKVLLEDNCFLCSICSSVLIDPQMCFGCQNSFCKECIEKWKKEKNSCPFRCKNASFTVDRRLSRMLSKLKFKCKNGCGQIIDYDNAKMHYNIECKKLEYNREEKIKELIKKLEEMNISNDKLKAENKNLKDKIEQLQKGDGPWNNYKEEPEIVNTEKFDERTQKVIVDKVKESIDTFGNNYMSSTKEIGEFLEQKYISLNWSVSIFKEGYGNAFVYYSGTPNIKIRYKGWFIKIYTSKDRRSI